MSDLTGNVVSTSAAATGSVPPHAHGAVLGSLRSAAARTGISFDFLLKTAQRESALDPNARTNSSTATGLFQFVEQTWFGVLNQYGAKFGFDDAANAITRSEDGKFSVANPETRKALLDLRKDPGASAMMAAALAGENRAHLETGLGRKVSDQELYLAHFLGPANAVKLLRADPGEIAATLFPAAARANPTIFFAGGVAATSGEVLHRLGISGEPASQAPPRHAARTPIPLQPTAVQGVVRTPEPADVAATTRKPEPASDRSFGQRTERILPLPAPRPTPPLSADLLQILLLFDPLIAARE